MEIGHCGQILDNVTKRLVERDIFGRSPAGDLAKQNLPDFGDDVRIGHQTGFTGDDEFCRCRLDRCAHIGDIAAAHDQRGIDLDRAGIA